MAVYLAHHGILGQKWGKKNGPPYPLDAEDHSAAEKKAGWKKSLSEKKTNKLASKAKDKADPITKHTLSKYTYAVGYSEGLEVGNKLVDQFIEKYGARDVIKYAKSDQFKKDVDEALKSLYDKNFAEMAQEDRRKKELMDEYETIRDEYDSLVKDRKLDTRYYKNNTMLNAIGISETDYPLQDYEDEVDAAKYISKKMREWVDSTESNTPSQEFQKKHAKDLDDAVSNRYKIHQKMEEDDDYFSGKDIDYLLKQKVMKDFFSDPVVKDILNTRNDQLTSPDSNGLYYDYSDYEFPKETERALRYRARSYFGGKEDTISEILEDLDTNQDYNHALNPYYHDAAWLYWH